VWINSCVGGGNIAYFLLFLLSNTALCTYGAIQLPMIVLGVVKTKQLWHVEFFDGMSGERYRATGWVIFQYLFGHHGTLIFLAILCIVFSLMVGAFTIWHFYSACVINLTSNESYKYGQTRRRLKAEKKTQQVNHLYNNGFLANVEEIFCPKRFAKLHKH